MAFRMNGMAMRVLHGRCYHFRQMQDLLPRKKLGGKVRAYTNTRRLKPI